MTRAREVYAKMSSSIDRNRKIRKGGRDARDVFLWVLRRVAERGATDWRIPAADVRDFEYLADELMCSIEAAEAGLKAAIRVDLLTIDGDDCVVVGGDDDWGRRPMTGAERTAKSKSRSRGNDSNVTGNNEVTNKTLPVTVKNSGNPVEERRGEEGEKESGKPDDLPGGLFGDMPEPDAESVPAPILLLAETACDEINSLTGSKYRPRSNATVVLCRALANARHTTDEVRLVVHEKHREWGGDPVMRRRVCPATLLALSNFERYLDEIQSRPTQPSRPTAHFDTD